MPTGSLRSGPRALAAVAAVAGAIALASPVAAQIIPPPSTTAPPPTSPSTAPPTTAAPTTTPPPDVTTTSVGPTSSSAPAATSSTARPAPTSSTVPRSSTTRPVVTQPAFVPPQGQVTSTTSIVGPVTRNRAGTRLLPVFVLLSIGGFALALVIVVAQFLATRR